jgi:hypothetical protein
MIKIGVKGKILKGRYPGWYIIIEPTGSLLDPYSILYSMGFDFKKLGMDSMIWC